MAIEKRVSVKEIIAKVYRDLQLSEETDWQSMIEWCGEALEHIGAYGQLTQRICELTVEDFKTHLPCDFISLNQISYAGYPLRLASSLYGNATTPSTPAATDQTAVNEISTPTLNDNSYSNNNTYTIDPAYIKTSFRSGTIIVSYTAFPIDDEGFPEVPDDISYREALFNYIVMKLKYVDWLNGDLPDNRYKSLVRLWEFSCKQSAAKMQMPSLDKMENLKDWSVRLLPNIYDYTDYFSNLGSPQRLNK